MELRQSDGPVLHVFSGAGGSAEEMAPLATRLTGDPRVVVLVPDASGPPPPDATVEAMAAEAAALVRRTQPHGPFHLLGYSFGGPLALEVARLLQAVGEDVAFLGLVDPLFDQRHWPTSLFVKATVRRAAVQARGLAGRPPVQAARELADRLSRLGRRVRHRYAAPTAGPDELATTQDVNLAVLARWRPRRFPGPVTLLTATESDFGCDLADLWRPWLPGMSVHRVPGDHLGLVQSPDGAQRLASVVSEAMQARPRLSVLVATTFRWPGAARLAVDFREVDCRVEAVAPHGSAVHHLRAVDRTYVISRLTPVRSLRRALESSGADLVVPYDDRTRHALGRLHARSDPATDAGSRVRRVLERSLGPAGTFAHVYDRATLMEVADAVGVRCPPTAVVRSADEVSAWLARNPGPAVLKTDGSWGGRGVAVVDADAQAQRAWRQMSRRPPLLRAVKQLVVEGDPWPLRARLAGERPSLSIQPFVAGRPANAAVACREGTTLGQVQAEVIRSNGPTGPSTVVRIVDDPDMAYAVKSVVSSLRLSGLCGLDFVIDDLGRAHLIELNPRATPTAHLIGSDDTDLLTALRAAWGHELPLARPAPYTDGLVALFPQEACRDPRSSYLQQAFHDVPLHAPDLVARVAPGRHALGQLGIQARERRWPMFRRRGAVV